MMVKITEYCSMGCKHCINAATTNGKDMKMETLIDVINFINDRQLCKMELLISGGEPTEHKEFDKFMNYIIEFIGRTKCTKGVIVATNGENIQKNPERFKEYIKKAGDMGFALLFKVSADVRFYPRRIETHKRIFREKGFILCDDCVTHLYPQGRALELEEYKYSTNAPKCLNAILCAAQNKLNGRMKFSDLLNALEKTNHFCIPHIKIDGGIGLGESDFCPSVASIYNSDEEILNNIINASCKQCYQHIDINFSALKQY